MERSQSHPVTRNRFDSAQFNRQTLRENDVLMFQLTGAPGSGRTTLLAASLRWLYGEVAAGVILADPGRRRGGQHVAEYCQQLVTLDRPNLDAAAVQDALRHMDLRGLEWILAEGCGHLQHPVAFDLGQSLTVAVFNVAGGDDKPAEAPALVRAADAVVLTQTDLISRVPFDVERFEREIHRVNDALEIFPVSAMHGTGMGEWVHWLRRYRIAKSPPAGGLTAEAITEMPGEWYFG